MRKVHMSQQQVCLYLTMDSLAYLWELAYCSLPRFKFTLQYADKVLSEQINIKV